MGLEKLLKGPEEKRLGNEPPLNFSLKATTWWKRRARPPPWQGSLEVGPWRDVDGSNQFCPECESLTVWAKGRLTWSWRGWSLSHCADWWPIEREQLRTTSSGLNEGLGPLFVACEPCGRGHVPAEVDLEGVVSSGLKLHSRPRAANAVRSSSPGGGTRLGPNFAPLWT